MQNKPETVSPTKKMDAYSLLGDCHLALKEYEAAVAAYKHTLKIEANAFEALIPMVQALHALKRDR